jgi:hypothetical protein
MLNGTPVVCFSSPILPYYMRKYFSLPSPVFYESVSYTVDESTQSWCRAARLQVASRCHSFSGMSDSFHGCHKCAIMTN